MLTVFCLQLEKKEAARKQAGRDAAAKGVFRQEVCPQLADASVTLVCVCLQSTK